MTPFASVAMLEKLALLKIALCKAPVVSRASVCPAVTTAPFAPEARRSEGLLAVVILLPSRVRYSRGSGRRVNQVGLGVRPNAERLERVLRDEPAMLANNHDGGDRRSFSRVAIHCRLNFDSRVFADGPLTVAAARTASCTACFESGDDFMLVVR